jgi:hypothetical protein
MWTPESKCIPIAANFAVAVLLLRKKLFEEHISFVLQLETVPTLPHKPTSAR